ncbi:MAG: TIGR03936 family radical SAM-associated protein [Pirellulales bacterium]|nr:TIGR03936 family radical SAM-associated protein [Pirellulales bacterium]
MTTYRVQMRFAKQGDLRWISHRDLVRTFERMFRRAGVSLGMTQGYHPRPKLTFPSALALGVEATDEIMEFLLAEEANSEELRTKIQSVAPEGLTIGTIRIRTMQDPKVQVCHVTYSFPIPPDRVKECQSRADEIMNSETYLVERNDGTQVDLHTNLEHISVEESLLQLSLAVDASGGTKPKDILRALQLEDLLTHGRYLTRTKVEIRA